MNDKMSDDKELIKVTLDMMKANNDAIMREFGEFLRQKNLWVAQVLTISSAILGGFLLSQQRMNSVISVGLGLLFTQITAGLILIQRSNKKSLDRLMETHGKSADYNLRLLTYFSLLSMPELTTEQQKIKKEIEVYFDRFFIEIGFIREDGTLGSIYEKLMSEKTIDWPNYLLIAGFFIAGMILTFSNLIANYLGISGS